MDKEKGNLVKADRFGYIKRAMHGTKMLSTREVRYAFLLLALQNKIYLLDNPKGNFCFNSFILYG